MVSCLRGEVRILRPGGGALTAVLTGVDSAGRPTEIGLVGAELGALPEMLSDARVERDGERLHLVLRGEEIELRAASFHVHHDLAAVMDAAVPGRPAPPARRLLLGALLLLAGSRAGLWLLRRLRPAARMSAR